MARHTLAEPRVAAVNDALIQHYLFHGSVRAVQRVLNDALKADGKSRLYPNRLHSLLSDDGSRGINTATLELFEAALAATPAAPKGGERDRLRALILNTFESEGAGAAAMDESVYFRVAEKIDVPVGVVSWVVADAGKAMQQGTEARRTRKDQPETPDWSFQDEAVKRCLTSLAAGPNRKVGLVVPTGGGKTRVAIRIALRTLAQAKDRNTRVVWVTHRQRLRTQARRELQRALGDGRLEVPAESPDLFERRIEFVMVSDLARALQRPEEVELVIVDEGHHGAAPSYKPVFERTPLRGLFLTATPNRADGLPIGIDEIAFSTTYRELFERGVVVEPSFDTPLTIEGLDWAREGHLEDLADYILSRAETDLRKMLVAVTRTDHAELLHDFLLSQLDSWTNHPVAAEDIGFVHGGKNSGRISTGEFLDEFTARPRGILVATSQLVGEGFDDPLLDGVVITYPSSSIGHLMQVAGRVMRWHPQKQSCHIIQVRPSALAYHFEQRWLYQDISDRLRPKLEALGYTSTADLREKILEVIGRHKVDLRVTERIARELEQIEEPGRYNLLLTGLPYEGLPDDFSTTARWGAVLVGPADRPEFVGLFNAFSDREAEVNSHQDFLSNFKRPDQAPGSLWKSYIDMLAAMEFARKEIDRVPYFGSSNRPYVGSTGTTWLKYITLEHRPAVPAALEDFLSDTLNRDAVLNAYAEEGRALALAAKVYLPLGSSWCFLLSADQAEWIEHQRAQITNLLHEAQPESAFAVVHQWRHSLEDAPIPLMLVDQIGQLISDSGFAIQTLDLTEMAE